MIFFDINEDSVYFDTDNNCDGPPCDCDESIFNYVLEKNGFITKSQNKKLYIVLDDIEINITSKSLYDKNEDYSIIGDIVVVNKNEIILCLNKIISKKFTSIIDLFYKMRNKINKNKLEIII
jgi:hypothetical protein